MTSFDFTPRHLEARLFEALSDSPIVLLHGPRQCGKSTLVRHFGEGRGYVYLTMDDAVDRNAAEADPRGFVDALPDRVILDEVQRAPALIMAIKAAIDRNRESGRFLLTGSAHALFVPHLSDSLAGRMEILRLHPLSLCEQQGKTPQFLTKLFAGDFRFAQHERLGEKLIDLIVAGGYPAALQRKSSRRRQAWYLSYTETLIQRDVQDLARIAHLDALPRLLSLLAGQSAGLCNITDLSAPFQVSRPTIANYVTLLEHLFLLDRIPPWHDHHHNRLIKTPKIHLGDTGLAAALLGLTGEDLASDRQQLGRLLETFVFQELRRQASADEDPTEFFHYRDRDQYEVDFVLCRGQKSIAGIEVKASATVTAADFRGLKRLQNLVGDRFRAGVVLYDGASTTPFGDRLFAVPLRRLWEPEP